MEKHSPMSEEEQSAIEWIESLGFKKKPLKNVHMWTLDGMFVNLQMAVFFYASAKSRDQQIALAAQVNAFKWVRDNACLEDVKWLDERIAEIEVALNQAQKEES